MGDLQRAFEDVLAKTAKDRGWSDADKEKFRKSLEDEVSGKASQAFLDDLREQAPAALQAEQEVMIGFRMRNLERWKRPLDELRIMLGVARDVGAELLADWNQSGEEPHRLAALNHVHVKALITTDEILCLIEGGFADGALARWRTLHELSVYAQIIAHTDEVVARRYLASFDFRSLKAALQVNKHWEEAGLDRFTDEEIAVLEARCAQHVELGTGLGAEYGWAWPVVPKARTLVELEEVTGLSHWRPRYRWASENVHGGYRPPFNTLGMAEAEESIHLVGPSNSGMVDPLHMTAISLLVECSAFFLCRPDLDRIVAVNALHVIAHGLGEVAQVAERESAERYKREAKDAET